MHAKWIPYFVLGLIHYFWVPNFLIKPMDIRPGTLGATIWLVGTLETSFWYFWKAALQGNLMGLTRNVKNHFKFFSKIATVRRFYLPTESVA